MVGEMSTTRKPADAAASVPLDATTLPEPFGAFAAALVARDRPVGEFVHLLETMAAKAEPEACVAFAEALRRAWPGHPMVHQRTGAVLASRAHDYHIPMIADAPRNRAYADAIAALIEPGMTVLEIGTGSGIMAMLAARAGAAHVHTVEVNPTMAAIARRNIRANGLEHRVTVIGTDALDLRVGAALPGRCDALIHELFDSTALGDHMFRLLAHARAELLTGSAILLPDRLELWGRLDGTATETVGLRDVCGVDLSALELLDYGYKLVGSGYRLEALSAPLLLAEVDLRPDFEPGRAVEIPVEISDAGLVHGLVQWIGFRFPDGTVYRNPPGVASHWAMVRSRFAEPTEVRPGETRRLTLHLGMNYVWYDFR
jgi:type II protein arginine methyltransferase